MGWIKRLLSAGCEQGISVERFREDWTRVRITFHKPVRVWRALRYADKVFEGMAPGDGVTVTESPPNWRPSDVASN